MITLKVTELDIKLQVLYGGLKQIGLDDLTVETGSHTSYFSIMYLLTSSMIIIYFSCNSITQIFMNVVFVLIVNLNQNVLLIRLTKVWCSDLISLWYSSLNNHNLALSFEPVLLVIRVDNVIISTG